MKKKIWNLFFIISWIPFVIPFGMWFFETLMGISSWDLIEFMILYSFVYWPTYLLGLAVMIVSLYFMKKK